MTHTLAVHSDQMQTTDAGRGHSLTRCGDVKRQSSTYEHRQTSAARSSLSPRHLGRGFGSGRFLHLGWSASLREICELRRVGLSGADARAASFNLQCGHQLAVQAISAEPPVVHLSDPSVRRLLDSHDANENGLPHAQGSFAPGAKAHD